MATPNKSPTGAVTNHVDFCKATLNDQFLFSVNAGIPLGAAFDQLSSLVSSSIASIEVHANGDGDTDGIPGALWQSVHLLNFAYALIQSMHSGHSAHEEGNS